MEERGWWRVGPERPGGGWEGAALLLMHTASYSCFDTVVANHMSLHR